MSTFIIAEAGVNHNGDLSLAMKLIDVAVEAGCDAIKFQTFKAEKLVTKSAQKAAYQIKNTGNIESQFELLKQLELTSEDFLQLFNYCKHCKIQFLSTAFDQDSVDLLEKVGLSQYKIPSGEITNKPLLQYIAEKQKPIIMSTGMSALDEVKEAIEWINEVGNQQISLLHCTSNYPADPHEVNLRAMLTLKSVFKTKVGYSDHTLGIEVPIAAVAMGAEIIEKHITLDRNMKGPDHKASLEPSDLKQLVRSLRNVELSMGDGIKKPNDSELVIRNLIRKSVVAKTKIFAGNMFSPENITIKRPGTGIEPKKLDWLIGKKAAHDIEADTIIKIEDIY